MEALGDWFTAALIVISIWTFIPDGVKTALRSGLGPSALALASAIRSAVPYVGRAMTWLIVGKVSGVSEPTPNYGVAPEPARNLTEAPEAPERTNEPSVRVLFLAAERLQVDRTRGALIAVLVEAGWQTVDIRNTLKGTASDLGDEIRTARALLAEDDERLLIVRDGAHPERVIVK